MVSQAISGGRASYGLAIALALGLGVWALSGVARADDTWLGSMTNHDWGTASNWLSNTVPLTNAGNLTFGSTIYSHITNANDNVTGIDTMTFSDLTSISGSGSFAFNSGGSITNNGTHLSIQPNIIASGDGLTFNMGPGGMHSSFGASSANTITLPDGAVLTINTSLMGDVTINSSITGAGSLVINGVSGIPPSTVFLTGNNTFTGSATINGGSVYLQNGHALQSTSSVTIAGGATLYVLNTQTIGSLAGAGDIALYHATENVFLTVNNTIDSIFSGQIQFISNSQLIKSGAGTLTFSGTTMNYANATTLVNQGTLNVTGDLATDVTVNSGGRLSGTGTVRNLTVAGIVAPGNSIGTLNVSGNYIHNAGATYVAEINDHGESDKIHATGNVEIQGGTLSVQAESGTYTEGMRYRVIEAEGTREGVFADVIDNLPFLGVDMIYGEDFVDFELYRTHVPYVAVVQTRNQFATATYLDALYDSAAGDLATVMQALDVLTAPEARGAFDQLAGEPYADLAAINIAAANLFADAAFSRMSTINGLDCGERTGRELWVYSLGNWQRQRATDTNYGYNDNVGGFMVGYDKQFDEAMIGFGSGYACGNQAFLGLANAAEDDVFNFSVYGNRDFGRAYLRGVVGYTHGSNDVTRTIKFDSLNSRQAEGSINGDLTGTLVQTGYHFDMGRVRLTPLAGLRYVSANMDGTTETGADSVNLVVDAYHRHSLASHLGGKLAFCMARKWRAECYAQWEREFGDIDSIVSMAFADSAPGFTVQGAAYGRNAVRSGLVVIGDLTNRISVNLNFDALARSNFSSQQLAGGLSLKF